MTNAAMSGLFAGYADAFQRRDADALVAAWSFPATISAPGQNAVLDEAGFRRNLATLFGFYARQGVAHADEAVSAVHPLSPDVAVAHVDYAMRDAGESPVAAWQTAYLVRDGRDGPRIFAAIADGEVAAWAARGTPLGAK